MRGVKEHVRMSTRACVVWGAGITSHLHTELDRVELRVRVRHTHIGTDKETCRHTRTHARTHAHTHTERERDA